MSAFQECAHELVAVGVSVLPIEPGTKRPGAFIGGRWQPMAAWDKYCARLPYPNEIDGWCEWPGAGIGVALGLASGLAVVDVDVPAESPIYAALVRALPATPCAKRGAKGISLFYGHNPEVPSRAFRRAEKTVVDVLAQGRQTVIPPTRHPDGMCYEWLGDSLAECARALPILPGDVLALIERTLAPFYPTEAPPAQQAPSAGPPAEDWRGLNEAALEDLEAWVPALIPDARRERNGYRCIAYWRGGDGWNVGIHSDGIRDFAKGLGMTALDLICAAKRCDVSDARRWLEDRLHISQEVDPAIAAFLQSGGNIGRRQTEVVSIGGEPATAEPPHPWEPQLATIAQARQWRDPLPYLVEGLLPCGRMGVVSGAPGSMKSMLLMHLGLAVASGAPWMGKAVSAGTVLWYNADSPTDSILDRLGAMAIGAGVADAAAFHLLSFPQPGLDLSSDPHIASAIRFIEKRGVRLMIIDALQRVKGGANENDATEMSKVMDGARRIVEKTGCSIVFVHHHTKPSEGKAATYRGSSAILDALDFAINCERDGERVTIRPSKERDAPIDEVVARFTFEHYEGTKKLARCGFEPGGLLEGLAKGFEDLKARILAFVESQPEPPSLKQIKEGVSGRIQTITTAVGELVGAGKLTKASGMGRRVVYSSGSVVPTGSQLVPGTAVSGSRFPSPFRGGNWEPVQHAGFLPYKDHDWEPEECED